MDKKDRKFAIPFNGTDADEFLKRMEPYLDNIEQVYLGIPSLAPNHQNIADYQSTKYEDLLKYQYNCYDFLSKTKNKTFKRFLTLNSPAYNWTNNEYLMFVNESLLPVVQNFAIDGVILADFELGLVIKMCIPNLEIQTSCNTYMWNIGEMHRWQDNLGIETFNPPREILRTPERLKEMHDEGFRLKCIVNESCMYGCPSNLNHCIHIAFSSITKNTSYYRFCDHCELSNIFKSNWILPRHLKLFDEYVSVYKIVGRIRPTNMLFDGIDAYVNERNDVGLLKCINGCICKRVRYFIPVKNIPDKILTCECKGCSGKNKTCNICDKVMEKVIKSNKKI